MRKASHWEIFRVFHTLGWSSFGGPTAHIGYFYAEFVERRQWLSAETFAQDHALCQIMPGPASSQLGMLIGARRAGIIGSLIAWVAFTAPSALIMFAVLLGNHWWSNASGVVQGLMISAAAVVFQAIWSMARSFCQQRPHQIMAITSAMLMLLLPSSWTQLGILLICLVSGARFITSPTTDHTPASNTITIPRWLALCLVGLYVGLLIISLRIDTTLTQIYQAGALVFGGGHVVLAMLQQRLAGFGLIDTNTLLSGYAAAQILPGPLFAFGVFAGGIGHPSPVIAGFMALIAIFLPGWLLIIGIQPWWHYLQQQPWLAAGLQGVQASVVGILAATLWDPIFHHGITTNWHMALWIASVGLLMLAKRPPWQISVLCAVVGGAVSLISTS